jgi:hypothetical protein
MVADIGLAVAVESLRAELLAAVEAGRGSALQFELDPVTLTVQAVVTKEGGGKVGWKILEASFAPPRGGEPAPSSTAAEPPSSTSPVTVSSGGRRTSCC